MPVETRPGETPLGSGAAPRVEFLSVSKSYGTGIPAVDGLDLTVSPGETLVLLGTSGSGKTTALKMVNRLVEPTSGAVRVAGRSVLEWNPVLLRRSIGYVIQEIGLLPHLTVFANVCLVPRLLGWNEQARRQRAETVLRLVGLDGLDLERRYPDQLSGGQRQRAGLARALAADPPLLLMDEPFGALDPVLRVTIQDEFLAISRRLGKTILFVTHDVTEAFLLGDRIGVMHAGRLVRLGTPAEILDCPGESLVERFLGRHRRFLADLLAERKEKEKQWTS